MTKISTVEPERSSSGVRGADPNAVLEYWFGEPVAPDALPKTANMWFRGGPAVDHEINSRFGAWLEPARNGALDRWTRMPTSALALIILLDQFHRNVFRGTAAAFSADPKALALVKAMIERGEDQMLAPIERMFIYVPFEHSEVLADQERGVALMKAAAGAAQGEAKKMLESGADYAVRHRDIVARFGRFPHRNVALGRESTAEEAEFLKQPGSSF